MQKPETRYAGSGAARIAYQVVGQGSLDLVLVPGFPSNVEILWEEPGYGRLVKRLLTCCRVVLFDPRGSGLSDGIDPGRPPDPQAPAEDIRAVMDAAGCGRAVLFGISDGAAQSIRFAAAFPDRVRALVLFGSYARFTGTVTDAKGPEARIALTRDQWGTGASVARMVPGRSGDPNFAAWSGRLERLSASPSAAAAMVRMIAAIDVRDTLAAVRARTLVLHRADDARVSVASGRQVAGGIRDARFAELPGRDHPAWAGDVDGMADLIEEFLTGQRPVADSDRVLAALLVARILGTSGGPAASAAGRHRLERLELFRDAVPRVMARHGGQARWPSADRIDAHFNSAARAAGCAIALGEAAATLGLAVAQGIHVGEIEVSLPDIAGSALDVADRIATSSRRHGILLSRLASDLVSGSGLRFVDRGTIAIEGRSAPLSIAALERERHLEPAALRVRQADLGALSPREREVLALVAEGLSNPHIAVQLGLSEHTVKRHVANLLLKLDLPTRAAAAGLAARQTAP